MDRRKVVVTKEEMDATRSRLAELAERLAMLSKAYGSQLREIDLKVEETRPLKPVYQKEGGEAVGYMQQGPCKLVITIEDYEHDGHIRAIDEAW